MAGLEDKHELFETLHQNHATELGKTMNTSKYRAVVTISGDGVFHEILNGLLGREDWQDAIKLPLGYIGAGISFLKRLCKCHRKEFGHRRPTAGNAEYFKWCFELMQEELRSLIYFQLCKTTRRPFLT